MSQFLFTAGTIHLLKASTDQSVESDYTSVKKCIAVLHSMGLTWKCASQSGDVLQRMLQEWCPRAASSEKAPATASTSIATVSHTLDIREMLQQNPEVGQQLQLLGWAPPKMDKAPGFPIDSTGLDLETMLTFPHQMVSIPTLWHLRQT